MTPAIPAEAWIRALGLDQHPEGDWYAETYRSAHVINQCCLGEDFLGEGRSVSTSIYYLLESSDVSRLHRLNSDEIWHFYAGDPLLVYQFGPRDETHTHQLHNSLRAMPQLVIPAGVWFGARSEGPCGYSLLGCTVAPGFDFRDFQLGTYSELIELFPEEEHSLQLFFESDRSQPAA